MEPLKLNDGSEWIPMEPKEKESLEAEIKVILDKYDAMYLPVIKKAETLQETKQTAALFILKKKDTSIETPYKEHGESTDTTEDSEINSAGD